MKRILNKLPRNERGVVLIIVLILLAVGGLTIAPMLSHMSTGLKAGQTYEKKTNEYYAADAGVEDALWQITTVQRDPHLPTSEGEHWSYSITDINSKSVAITIDYVDEDADGNDVYKIDSTATGAGGGDTTIESYAILGGGFAFILDNAITSPGDVAIAPGTTIEGDVHYNGTLDNKGTVTGDITSQPMIDWPTPADLIDFYDDDVAGVASYGSTTLDIGGVDTPIGPFYRDGDLAIINSSGTPATLTLNDTLYVTGDLSIGSTNQDFTLDLNNQTIFVESPSADPAKAIWLGSKCAVTGAGCIITVGDIYFEPNLSGDSFVLVMSIDGLVNFQPGESFTGCLAGNVEVALNPGSTLTWEPGPPADLNFPDPTTGDSAGRDVIIRTWETQ